MEKISGTDSSRTSLLSLVPAPHEDVWQIFTHIPDAIFRITGGGIILSYKPSSMNLLHVADGRELVGLHISELAHRTSTLDEELIERCLRQVQLVLERDKAQCFEVQLKASAWPLWLEIRAFRSGEDQAVVVIREVSQERRNRLYQEGELEQLRDLVQCLSDERDSERRELGARLTQLSSRATGGMLAKELGELAKEIIEGQTINPGGLGEVLQATISTLCGASVEAHVRIDLACEHLSSKVATGIHSILREALTCTTKSSAERVRVSLVNTEEELSLLISDNSTDESPTEVRERTICLAKIRYQAQKLGGTLRVTPGRRGIAMRLRLPLR
ncbi:MAG: hypothetical protein JRH20_04670 [Deltaproteobacteria bacterium]|nr:hypothetical protein [Deltaproteobacteria bacterium]